MTLEDKLSQELDHAVEQASATAGALSSITGEIRAILIEERHSPSLSAQVLAAQSKRAALILTNLAGLVGQIETLARLGAH